MLSLPINKNDQESNVEILKKDNKNLAFPVGNGSGFACYLI